MHQPSEATISRTTWATRLGSALAASRAVCRFWSKPGAGGSAGFGEYAADSLTGLDVLRSEVRIDLLITDVGLPGGMNGRQMADAARQVRPGLKTFFITGYAESAALGDGQLEPGMHVLIKPFAVDTLAARVRELMNAQ